MANSDMMSLPPEMRAEIYKWVAADCTRGLYHLATTCKTLLAEIKAARPHLRREFGYVRTTEDRGQLRWFSHDQRPYAGSRFGFFSEQPRVWVVYRNNADMKSYAEDQLLYSYGRDEFHFIIVNEGEQFVRMELSDHNWTIKYTPNTYDTTAHPLEMVASVWFDLENEDKVTSILTLKSFLDSDSVRSLSRTRIDGWDAALNEYPLAVRAVRALITGECSRMVDRAIALARRHCVTVPL